MSSLESRNEVRLRPSRRIVRRGWLATAIAPLAAALAALLLIAGLVAIGTNWWAGYSRDQLFGRAVQPDGSTAAIATGTPLVETVTVVVRDADGELRRLVVERDAADRFVNDTLRRLDAARQATRERAAAEVATVLDLAFADADAAVEHYADWFFAWRRAYVVLGKAIASTTSRLARVGAYEPLEVGVERDLQDYFMAAYQSRVLRPEEREPIVARAFDAAARRAHERWLGVLAEEDLRLRLFLAEHTRHLDPLPADTRLSELTLDWDAQRFKAPYHLSGDRVFDGLVGVATAGGGAVAGAALLGPAAQRASRRVFAGLGRRYATAFASRIAMAQSGAAVGSAVQPVSGTALGALAGGLLGLAADYALNEADEAFNRETFVEANREAVAATRSIWEERLTASLHAAIDQWFADTRAAVVAER